MQVITMRQFGGMGRFANQMFQYAFLKTYALRYGCALQLPPWVGQHLFGCDEPPVTEDLPEFREHAPLDWALHPMPPAGAELAGHDFRGYAQYHTSVYVPFSRYWWNWFDPVPLIAARMMPAVHSLKARKRPVVGIHLRRGDYGQMYFYITPVEWYLRFLREWPIENPLLFVASETPALAEEFRAAGYDVETTETLGVALESELPHYQYLGADRTRREPWQMDFYPDFFFLSQCDHLLVPNSTFSFAAAMMNPNLKSCWRSCLLTQRFHRIDPWDDWPMERHAVDDYPVPGTYLDSNPPYWDKRTQVRLTRQIFQ